MCSSSSVLLSPIRIASESESLRDEFHHSLDYFLSSVVSSRSGYRLYTDRCVFWSRWRLPFPFSLFHLISFASGAREKKAGSPPIFSFRGRGSGPRKRLIAEGVVTLPISFLLWATFTISSFSPFFPTFAPPPSQTTLKTSKVLGRSEFRCV